jgi:hypothetical protein
VPALIALTPLGGIPGLPKALAVVVIVVAAQFLIMKRFWLPNVVVRRSIERGSLRTPVNYLRPVARAIDKVIRSRLAWLTRG